MTSPLAPQPFTGDPPPGVFPLSFSIGLALDPTGTWCYQANYDSVSNAYRALLYRRDGDTWRICDGPIARQSGQGLPGPATWTPDGRYLAVLFSPDYWGPDTGVDQFRMWLYRRDGDRLTAIGPSVIADAGSNDPTGGIAFDPTGRYLAVAALSGFNGLLRLDGEELTVTHGGQYDPVTNEFGDEVSYGLAWNPADPTLLVRINQANSLQVWRRTGSGALVPVSDTFGGVAQHVAWHPSGRWIVGDTGYGCMTIHPTVYEWPSLRELGRMYDFPNTSLGFSFDPTGRWFAGGNLGYNDTYTGLVGLRVAAVGELGGDGDAASGYQIQPALPDAEQALGQFTSWAHAGGTSYLAASTGAFQQGSFTNAWGWKPYRIGAAAAASILSMRMPDGRYVKVGVSGQPLSMRMPDGSWRTWPGAAEPLHQLMPDGTWRKVIG